MRERDVPRFDWKEEHIALLGKEPDASVAYKLGISRNAVKWMRLKHRIPVFKEPEREWTPGEVALLGKVSDAEVARQTGRSHISVKEERYIRKIAGVNTAKWSAICYSSRKAR